MEAVTLQGRATEFLDRVRTLVAKDGIKTAEALIGIARGKQPDALAARRLLRSGVGVYLLINGDGSLGLSGVNRLIALRMIIRGTRCVLLPAGPLLPDPDSKPPPRT